MKSIAHRAARLGRSPRLRAELRAIAALAAGLTAVVALPADARVNPLTIIQRQIHKANMLIVLDTSGSMAGVPGGTFYYKTEAGVDCDSGLNCRQAGVMGTCVTSGKSCYADDDCRRGTCSANPAQYCGSDLECKPLDYACAVTGGACTVDKDCPTLGAQCSASGDACTPGDASTGNCPAVGKCPVGPNVSCTNFGSSCPATGTCAVDSTIFCTDNTGCPQQPYGDCRAGGTPLGGCSDNSDCPSKMTCLNTDETCSQTTHCPGLQDGHCSITGAYCTSNGMCFLPGETCVGPTNPCVGPPNPCIRSYTTCNPYTGSNLCQKIDNNCIVPVNNCQPATPSVCTPPLSSSDVCGPSTTGIAGPIRMCRVAQTVCAKNSDCPTSGDSCGPATSRMVIAKRAINSVITSSYDIVNFGFMTFYQKAIDAAHGYDFPYYQVTSTGSTGMVTEFESKDKLVAAHCWTPTVGPASSCVISGTPMTVRPTQNSRYTINTGTAFVDVEEKFCGDTCPIVGLGTGVYDGSFYQYQSVQGGNSTESLVMPSYTGKNINVSGVNYTYYQALTNYYNGGMPPPFTFTNCETTGVCGAQCGGRWDPSMTPFLDTSDDPVIAQNNVLKISQRLEAASYGGLLAYWSTPTGCTLQNDSTAASPNNSAYHYMSAVEQGDSVRCRQNYVLLITDGAANGPGDVDTSGNSLCNVPACAAADPVAAGCQCRSVLATFHLHQDLGVKTFVIGFSGDASSPLTKTINDNMARAGGTDAGNDGVAPFAYFGLNEEELTSTIQTVVLDAVKGSYSTSTTSSSAGTQQSTTVTEGKYALDSRVDFPEWRGHLIAYDLSGTTSKLAWDAYTQLTSANNWSPASPLASSWYPASQLASINWKARRIYTWDGSNMVKFQVDPNSGAIINKAALAALGLGADATEAEKVARWALGDSTYKNPAVLGAIVNSTPIDVSGPGDIPLPGGHAFFLQHNTQPHLVYVGSSDGMLHAFFLENTILGNTLYTAGSEAFAFVPPDMLSVILHIYAQGGQKADPSRHIFGLANSPKVKTMCISGCGDGGSALWKTLLIMPEGYGGNHTFMLDITNPFSTTGINDPPVTVRWHTSHGASAGAYAGALGDTVSLPAFFLNKTTNMDDYRVIFTSGYPVTVGSATQGRALITASASTGAVVSNDSVGPAASCGQEYTALTDVATARDFAKDQGDKVVAGYFGDTAGRLWRYMVGGGVTADSDFSCDHPLHFAPTVVQLDRDDLSSAHAHEIYPVQVTNSTLDLDTTNLPPSKMIFWKEAAQADTNNNITSVTKDTTWGTSGQIVLTVGHDNEICGTTQVDSHGNVSCKTSMPLAARPTATPLGVLRSDASGFQVMTIWYVPAPDGCSKGTSYLTIHQMSTGTNTVTQRMGVAVANEPVTSPIVMNGHVYVIGSSGPIDITNSVPDVFAPGRAVSPSSYGGIFTRINWTELIE